MKGRIGGLLAACVICIGSLLWVPINGTAAETQTEQQTERQTEEEEEKVSGEYDSKKTYGIDQEFDKLSGNAKYLGSAYRQNYYLDLEKTGITEIADAAANGLANMLFSALQMLAMLTCSIVYYCLEFSLSESIASFVTDIQKELLNGVYQQLWLLGVAAMGASIVGKMLKRQMAEILLDLCMVVLVTVLAALVGTHSAKVLTASSDLTKSVSNSIFKGLDTATGMSGGDDYAAAAAGSLWVDMIHSPWLTLEFGSVNPDGEVVEELLSLAPKSTDRKDVVKDMTKETGCFASGRGWGRLGMLLCYIIPFLLKGAVFILIGVLQFLGQILAMFVLLLAVFVLALAMIPAYGASIIQKWLGKFLDVHLSMAILSFLMALLIWLNKVLFSFAGDFGWLICLLFQAVVCVLLFLNYRTILFMLLHPRDGMSEINRMMRRMQRQSRFSGFPGGKRTRYEWEPERKDIWEEKDDGEAWEEEAESRAGYGSGSTHGYRAQGMQNIQPETNEDYDMAYDYESARHGPSRQEIYEMFEGEDEGSRRLEIESMGINDYESARNAPTQQEIYEIYEEKQEDNGGDLKDVGREDAEKMPGEKMKAKSIGYNPDEEVKERGQELSEDRPSEGDKAEETGRITDAYRETLMETGERLRGETGPEQPYQECLREKEASGKPGEENQGEAEDKPELMEESEE